MIRAAPGERWTIRNRIVQFTGQSLDVFDAQGNTVAFCRQKAFRLREDIRLYTDSTRTEELLIMRARTIIDFSVTYDITLPDATVLGSLRRKGMRSLIRNNWIVYTPDEDPQPIGELIEDSTSAAVMRRFIPLYELFAPKRLHLNDTQGTPIATFRTHHNPFVHRLGISIHRQHPLLDDFVILAAGCLFMTIDGRQRNSGGGASAAH